MKSGKMLLVGAITLLSLVSMTDSALAKRKWTITQRQEALSAQINRQEKTNELTKKEADGLRAKLASVSEKIAKMKEKNAGQLSYKDEGKIEKELNAVSLKLKKYELEKRTIPH